ncbi:MAG TPA: pyruvate dehydrogenase (acetyl-transferring) E1 component subunit alpha [Steroidobacteraceae bacterium]|nr:pyruvate dehydrogenase (acetyl-transferring) E1 component subunit alpha [Steroidobacteraceae bacterium]
MKTVAEFAIKYCQFLDAEGNLAADAPALASDTSELLKMYRFMTLARAFDSKAVNLQRTGQLGTYASCLGHEATHVGVAAAMQPDDVLAPVYREFGSQIWRGVKMSSILLYWGGDERGSDFEAREDFPWCVPIASQVPHGAGVAMAMKIRGEKRCSVTYIGDGGTSEGAFYEGINLAGARALPAVFVVVNNGWAISIPIGQQTATKTLAQKAIAAGIPGVQVDGNDVIAVRHVVGEALARARRGDGPTVVEALTYRLSDHTTADDASRYRDPAEVKEAWNKEPLPRLRAHLTKMRVWDAAREEALKNECAREIEAAVDEYLSTPLPSTDAMFDHLFANPPQSLLEQREIARRYKRKH